MPGTRLQRSRFQARAQRCRCKTFSRPWKIDYNFRAEAQMIVKYPMIPSKSLLNLTHAQSPSFQPFPRSSHSSVLLVGSTFMFWKAFWTWHRTTQQSRQWRSNTSKRYDGAPCSPSAILLHPGCCPQITRITCQHETTSRLPWWMQSLWSCFACCQKHGRKTIRNKEVSCEWKCTYHILPYAIILICTCHTAAQLSTICAGCSGKSLFCDADMLADTTHLRQFECVQPHLHLHRVIK